MKKIIVELEDIDGYWNAKDITGINWSTGIGTSMTTLKEVELASDEDKLKRLLKLKDAGFSAEEIIDLKKLDLL